MKKIPTINSAHGSDTRNIINEIIKAINDRGLEILSESSFLNWLDRNGVKHLGEWDDTKEYDRLSVVLHEGASYTSKKNVPVGIDIDNEEFWVLTGNYNAQIEHYRNDVKNLVGDKSSLPQWLNDTISSVTKLHDDDLRSRAVNIKMPPFNARGNDTDTDGLILKEILESDFTEIYIPDGIYTIDNDDLRILINNKKIIGGHDTVIKIKDNFTSTVQGKIEITNNVTIKNIIFDASGGSYSRFLRFQTNGENCVLLNTTFKNFVNSPGETLWVIDHRPGRNSDIIDNCKFYNIRNTEGTTARPIYVQSDLIFSNNHLDGVYSGDDADLFVTAPGMIGNIKVINNTFLNWDKRAIKIQGGTVSIVNNTMINRNGLGTYLLSVQDSETTDVFIGVNFIKGYFYNIAISLGGKVHIDGLQIELGNHPNRENGEELFRLDEDSSGITILNINVESAFALRGFLRSTYYNIDGQVKINNNTVKQPAPNDGYEYVYVTRFEDGNHPPLHIKDNTLYNFRALTHRQNNTENAILKDNIAINKGINEELWIEHGESTISSDNITIL